MLLTAAVDALAEGREVPEEMLASAAANLPDAPPIAGLSVKDACRRLATHCHIESDLADDIRQAQAYLRLALKLDGVA